MLFLIMFFNPFSWNEFSVKFYLRPLRNLFVVTNWHGSDTRQQSCKCGKVGTLQIIYTDLSMFFSRGHFYDVLNHTLHLHEHYWVIHPIDNVPDRFLFLKCQMNENGWASPAEI